MSKKNRKSLFAWCIRTLAISLVPTLILVSCASDSDDDKAAVDTTAPTFSTTLGGSTIVGTNNLTVTFNEAVTGVSGNETDGTCDATKTVKLTNYAGTCYGMTIVAAGNVYTINPKTDLVSGSYTLTLGAGIKDAAGNALGESAISFAVEDAKTTISVNLRAALSGITGAEDIVSAVSTAISPDSVTNSLSVAMPLGYKAAIAKINTMDGADYISTMTKVVKSLFGNFEEPSSATTGSRSAEANESDDEKGEVAAQFAAITATEVLEIYFESVAGEVKAEGLKTISPTKKAEILLKIDKTEVQAVLNDPSLSAAEKQEKVQKAAKASVVAALRNVGKSNSAFNAAAATTALNASKEQTKTEIQAAPGSGVDANTFDTAATSNIAANADTFSAAETTADATPDDTTPTTPEDGTPAVVVPPTVTLSATPTTASEGTGSVVLEATLSTDTVTTEPTIITLATTGTATSGTDYTLTGNPITIAAGLNTGSATLTIVDDTAVEDAETIIVDVSGVSGGNGATESGEQKTTISIADNDVAPTVTLTTSATSINEGAASSARTVTITAVQSKSATEATAVTLSTSGTATSGTDYTLASSSITIAAGQTEGTTTLTILTDTVSESSETVIIDIGAVTGGGGAKASVTQQKSVTIVDDDGTVTVSTIGTTTINSIANYYTTATPTFSIVNNNSESVVLTRVTSSTDCPNTTTTVATGTGNYTLGTFTVIDQGITCSYEVNGGATIATGKFSVDFAGPTIASVTMDTVDNTTSKVVQFDLNTVQDNLNGGTGSGTAAYYVKDHSDNATSSVLPSSSASGWVTLTNHQEGNSVPNQSYTLTDTDDNETKVISVFTKDDAGNVGGPYQTTFRLGVDSTQPTLTKMMIRDVGTNVDNATFTDNETVKLVVEATDAQSGVRYVIVTDNSTIANQIDNGTRGSKTNGTLLDNLTNSTFADGTQVIKSDNSTNFLSDNGTQVIVTGAFISNLTSGSKQLWSWVADGAKNISDNVTAVSAAGYRGSDSIYLDSVSPTATIVSMTAPIDNLTNIDNQTFTDNDTVTIVLDYNDNGTAQYYVSETNTAPSQYVDNISGAMNDSTYRDQFTSGFTRANVTTLDNGSMADNLTKSTWSILDNGTGDNASTYTVSGDWTGDNQTITYKLSTGDGLKTVYVWVKDRANRVSLVANDNITVDATGPTKTSSAWSLKSGSTATDNLTVVIDNQTLFTDAGVGVHRLYFNDNATKPSSDNVTNGWFDRIPTPSTADNLTYNFANGSGSYSAGDSLTLYVWAVDNLSNISDNYTHATITFDNAAPTAGDNATVTGAVTYDNQTFYINSSSSVTFGLTNVGTDNTTLTYHVNDNVSKTPTTFSSAAASTREFTLASDNDNQTLFVWAQDQAGNISATPVDNLSIVMDNTAPIFDNLTLAAYDNGTGSAIVIGDDNITIVMDNVTDNFSGMYYYYLQAGDNSITDNFSITSSPSTWTRYNGGSVNKTISMPVAANHEEGQSRKVYATMIDRAHKFVTTELTLTIQAGNPSVSNVTLYNPTDNTTDNITGLDNVTVQITGVDSNVGGMITQYSISSAAATSPTNWQNLSSPGYTVSENVSFDLRYIVTPGNNTALSLYVWLKDNSSKVSDNYSMDNITYYTN
jgi:hypothetical protein